MKKRIIGVALYLALMCMFCKAALARTTASAADVLFETGKRYYEEGNYEQALHELEKALLAEPSHAQALMYIQIIKEELALPQEKELTQEEIEELKEFSQEVEEEAQREQAVMQALEEAEQSLREETKEEIKEEVKEEQIPVAPPEVSTEKVPEEKVSFSPFKKFDHWMSETNEKIAPAKISGEYTVSLGARDGEAIWKEANGDYNETNWRRVDKNFGVNTYDTRVYDRLRLNIDTEKETGLNLHSNLTIDPWSFIGKTEAVNISSPAGERANVQLKYWSANRSIINDTILTLDKGAAITIPETKVVDGKVRAMTVNNTFNESLSIPELKVDEELWPIRELWLDYTNGEKLQFRFFPVAYQDQALTSDDPLQLSNHRIYWEESPWLDRWQPGILNTGGSSSLAAYDFTKGEWEDDLSFFTRDSNMTRLTSLRGFSMKSQPWEKLSISSTVAAPKGLWQDYDAVDNIEGATRLKFTPAENLQLGLINTFRYGLEESKRDAENRVIGADLAYQFASGLALKGEVAYSNDKQDLTQKPYNTKKEGNVYRLELQKGKMQEERPEKWDKEAIAKAEPFNSAVRLRLTHMDKGFYPALANYRITRRDPFWARHLYFKEPYKEYYGGLYYPTLSWYDIRPYRIGDSVDIDRDVIGLRLEKAFLGGALETLLDARNAHEASSGKYIETVSRSETSWQANDKLLIKLLGIYQDLPHTKGGIDPILYDVDTNQFFHNSSIRDDRDPSLKTASTGFQYDFCKWLAVDFIYEYTNDFTVALDDYPRSLLDDSTYETYVENGLAWRRVCPSIYNQSLFPLPPYPWFNVYKTGLEFAPNDEFKLRLEFTKNDYKYAGQIDDNINHLGFTSDWDITDRLSLQFNYTYSKCYIIDKATSEEPKYTGHHNLFVNLDYKMEDKGVFSLQFGEAAILPYSTMFTTSPYPGFLPTLDTAHIIRAYFSRKF